MKLQTALYSLVIISLLSVSAKTDIEMPAPSSVKSEAPIMYPLASNILKPQKLNFFQRLMYNLTFRKYIKADTEKADRQAKNSLIFGIAAVGAFLLGLAVPYVMFLTIPAGIVAMVLGSEALKSDTNESVKARTGKALGLGSLIAFGVILILAAIVVAAWANSWNW